MKRMTSTDLVVWWFLPLILFMFMVAAGLPDDHWLWIPALFWLLMAVPVFVVAGVWELVLRRRLDRRYRDRQ